MKGWLFDAYYKHGKAYVWLLSEGGTFYRKVFSYSPYILVDFKDESLVQDLSEVAKVSVVRRKLVGGGEKDMALVEPSWESYGWLVKKLKADRRAEVYDDLLPIQKFPFTELKVKPGRKLYVQDLSPIPLDYDPEPMPLYVGQDPEADIVCGKSCSEVKKRSDDPVDELQGSCAGRIAMNGAQWFECSKQGLAYVQERSIFAFLPLGLAARWSSNKVIDSRNAFTLISQGFAVPKLHYSEPSESLREFLKRDRGGYTIPAEKPGVYFNVAAIDFESEYPNIIRKEKISYSGHGWLIPEVVDFWISRRLTFKKLYREEREKEKAELYKARSDSLKIILVSEYGISGCALNRFGNHYAFEEINLSSRKILLKAKEIAENEGFTLIYADVDSLFLHKEGAKLEDYKALAEKISSKTGIPAVVDKHFKSIAFVKAKSLEGIVAIKRYFGVTYDGEVEARGIELRRSDYPKLVKLMQEELIKEIYFSESLEEAKEKASKAAQIVRRYAKALREGSLDPELLLIEKRVGKDPESYKTNVAQKIVAEELGLRAGDKAKYFIGRRGPELAKEDVDWKKYLLMLLSAAETVLHPLGLKPMLEEPLEPSVYVS